MLPYVKTILKTTLHYVTHLYWNSIKITLQENISFIWQRCNMCVWVVLLSTVVPPILFQICGGDVPYVAPDSLLEKHNFFKCEALHHFSSIKKMGGKEFCAPYQVQLEAELNELWESFSKHNEVSGKNRGEKIYKLFYARIFSWYLHNFFPNFFLFSVKEPFQCIPHTSSAFCPGLSFVCALCAVTVHRPEQRFIHMWLYAGSCHGSCGHLGLYSLFWPVQTCWRCHRPGGWSVTGAGMCWEKKKLKCLIVGQRVQKYPSMN